MTRLANLNVTTSNTAVRCRSCDADGLVTFLDLGHTPLADGLVNAAHLSVQDETFPLQVAYCPGCALVQILETVPPEKLFCNDYPYFSSFSDLWLSHSRDHALELIRRQDLNGDSFVVELASNDGYLLRNFVELGIEVLGIDPADGPAAAALKAGVPTMCTFFTRDLAYDLLREGRQADVIIANNVLAHVADTNGFVEGMRMLLAADGVISIEVPYVRDLVDHCEFDTIYHQHLCYFSATSLDKLFRQHNLYLNEIKRLPTHGGSLRLCIGHRDEPAGSVTSLLEEEKAAGVDRLDYYEEFSQRVQTIIDDLGHLVRDLREKGHRIAGYGAAAKACTLLNVANVGANAIEYIVDRNVHKQGKYMPGVRIPIQSPDTLLQDMPDYVLLLIWNLIDEIMPQQQAYRDRGGKFIVPIPTVRVV